MIKYTRKSRSGGEREATSNLNPPCTRHCGISHDTVG